MLELKYSRRGVSASKQEVHTAIRNLDKGLYPSAFCKILPDIVAGDSSYVNVMHADTAGTKPILAYLAWRETGETKYWKNVVQDAMVMNLDDMGCVGCTSNILLSSTIARNRTRIPGEILEVLIEGTIEFMDLLQEHGIKIHHTGGETADVGDLVRTVDVGFTTFSRMKKENLLVNNIKKGNVIIGLASFGQAKYEEEYNSGIGSNGLTSARHDVLNSAYAEKYPESFESEIPADLIYSGSKNLTDQVMIDENTHLSVADLLLAPTRTYLPFIKRLIAEVPDGIHGMIHCTGGGQTKVINFANGVSIIKDNLFETPPVFSLIQSESDTSWEEMYKVFNMGHRLEIYATEEDAEDIISLAGGFKIPAQIIGRVEEAGEGETTVMISSPNGEFKYNP